MLNGKRRSLKEMRLENVAMLAIKFSHIFTHCERAYLPVLRPPIAKQDHRLRLRA